MHEGLSRLHALLRGSVGETGGQKLWGPRATRRFFGDAHWLEPRKWNDEAKLHGERVRVFCASMADVFEERRDLDPSRERLWGLIEETTQLDWLLLTKRPERVAHMAPWKANWPKNVWIGSTVGSTVEDQKSAEERLPHLARLPAAIRFISAEPLLRTPATLSASIFR
jgi:protein gp37